MKKFLCGYTQDNKLHIWSVSGKDKYNHITENKDEIIRGLANFTNRLCYVKIKGNSIVIYDGQSDVSFTICEYETILKDFDFRIVKDNINRLIETNGLITSSTKEKYSRPKRNPRMVGSILKAVGGITLAASILVNPFLKWFETNNKQDEKSDDNIPPIAYAETISMIEHDNHKVEMCYENQDLQDLELDTKVDETLVEDKKDEIIKIDTNNQVEELTPKKEYTVNLAFKDYSDSDKAIFAKNEYYDVIYDAAIKYGLDPDLVLAIATQERGVHSDIKDSGGAIGLMQIQYKVWVRNGVNLPYYEYNANTGLYEKKVLESITDDMVKDLKGNIEIGCLILQDCLIRAHYNVPVAIQMYNMGCPQTFEILDEYAASLGKTRNQVLNNPSDIGWVNYRKGHAGDTHYLENVNKWVFDNNFTVIDVTSGEALAVKFTNDNEEMIHQK